MRPQKIQVGPLTAPSANRLATSQRGVAAKPFVLDGAGTDAVATAVCASQSGSAGVALTINGTKASGGVAYFGQNRSVYVTSAGNDSGITFTIVGTQMTVGPNTVPVAVREVLTGANTGKVATLTQFYTVTSITPSGATAAAVTVGMNGVATLDSPRRVLFTPAGADSGITLAFTGTNYADQVITETLAGVDNPSTAYTVLDYKTVTSIIPSGATASTATFGTNGVASSPWANFDPYAVAQVVGECVVSGTVNYTVQQTMDDPNNVGQEVAPASMAWLDSADTAVVSATANKMTSFAYAPRYIRIVLNSNTNPGYVAGTFNQFFGPNQPGF